MIQSARPEFDRYLLHLLRQVDVIAALDILFVAIAIYYLLALAQGTRAMQLLKGLTVLLVVMKAAQWLGMDTLQWIIGQVIFASAVILVILFQPELRAALDQIGRGYFDIFTLQWRSARQTEAARSVGEITKAVERLAMGKTGALIVIERETGLDDIAATGHLLNARLSAELLQTIFYDGNPLHDGAALVCKNEIVAATCILPLTQEHDLPRTVGTRHRAALGLSETSDAIIVVVSEETGNVSLAVGGTMNSILQPRLLADELVSLLSRREGATRLRPFARSVSTSVGKVGAPALHKPRPRPGVVRGTLKTLSKPR
jgi:diadenylate cyclase